MRRIGAHLSTAGGYNNGVDRAIEIGANALQIFSGSPRTWKRKPIDKAELAAFQKYAISHDVRPLFVHALYLVNMVSDKTESVQKSKEVLIHELEFTSIFQGAGLIVHAGSHQGRGWEAVKEGFFVLMKNILEEAAGESPLLIENSAGQKGKLHSTLGEIRETLDAVNSLRLGWCYDTCHGWAAGYSAVAHNDHAERKDLFATFEKYDLWDSLKCIHVNDSRDPFGSGRDRHENIGEGTIPSEELSAILNHPKLQNVPIITEVPGFDGAKSPDAENILRLRSIVGE